MMCPIAGEAEAALVAAGQKFLAVAQQNPEDRLALGNWGNALCLRAELAQGPEVRMTWTPAFAADRI